MLFQSCFMPNLHKKWYLLFTQTLLPVLKKTLFLKNPVKSYKRLLKFKCVFRKALTSMNCNA